MPKHGSINLYVHGSQKARQDGQPRTATSTLTELLNYEFFVCINSIAFIRRCYRRVLLTEAAELTRVLLHALGNEGGFLFCCCFGGGSGGVCVCVCVRVRACVRACVRVCG